MTELPTTVVTYSSTADEEINRYDLSDRLKLVDAIILLQHNRYREETKARLNAEISGFEVWMLRAPKLSVIFHTYGDGNIYVHWVSRRSRFRP